MVNIPPSLNKFLASDPSDTVLPSYSVLGLKGPDAIAFAQAQFMNDVALLDVMQWQWNGWLNTKGRVIALFLLLRVADDELLIVSPDMPAAELGRRLIGYVLRNRLQLGVWSELECVGRFGASAATDQQIAGDWTARQLELNLSTALVSRSLHLQPRSDLAVSESAPAWAMVSLLGGIPSLSTEQIERWTPHQLSLQLLQAVSVRKGCYPGQEIVARTHFLGRNKRQLTLLNGESLTQVDAATLVSVAQFGDDRVGLAVL